MFDCLSLRSGMYALRRFLLVVVRRRSVPCLLRLCLVWLEVCCISALVPFVFVGCVFVLLAWMHPLRGRVRDFIGQCVRGGSFLGVWEVRDL